MLHILLLILKILLWVILGLLGIALLLILLVLFAPVRYRVEAEYNGQAKVCAKIHFLILSVKIFFDQKDKSFENVIRIAGFRILSGDKDGKPKKRNKGKKFSDEEDDNVSEVINETAEAVVDKLADKIAEPVKDAVSNLADSVGDIVTLSDNDGQEKAVSEDEADNSALNEEYDLWDNDDKDNIIPEEEKSVFGRIKAFFKGLVNKAKNIITTLDKLRRKPAEVADKVKVRIDNAKKKIDRLKKFWNMSCTVKTRAYLKKYIISLFRHIGPRRIKGHVHYGFDEPYKTGQVTGYLSLMPFVYQKGFSLEPDFYNKVIEGNIMIKGRIRLGYILRIALNINIWKTIRLARKI